MLEKCETGQSGIYSPMPCFALDGVCNSHGEVRLNLVKGVIDYDDDDDVKFVKDLYKEWVQHDEYLVLKRIEDLPNFSKHKWFAVKCSKRGNDVYQERVENRLHNVLKGVGCKVKNRRGIIHTNGVCLTLTFDSNLMSRKNAWRSIGEMFNKYLSAVKKKYGNVKVVRSWESFKNGYPHIHALLIFEKHFFPTFKYGKNKNYRIPSEHKEFFEDRWHSFVDVQGVVDFDNAVENVVWYIMKNKKSERDYHNIESWAEKDIKTSVALWFFNKRSFSISGGFAEFISVTMHNSNLKSAQSTLDGIKAVVSFEFLGLVPGDLAKIQSSNWCKVFDECPDWIVDVRLPRLNLRGLTGDWNSN